jgi:hypothetical protein
VSRDPGAPARTAAGLGWRPAPDLERCLDAAAFEARACVTPGPGPSEEYGGCGPGCGRALYVVSAGVLPGGKAPARSGTGGAGLNSGKPGVYVSGTAAAVAGALEDARAGLCFRAAKGTVPGPGACLG